MRRISSRGRARTAILLPRRDGPLGEAQPAVSLYFEVSAEGLPLATQSRVERIPIAANLRHARYDVLNAAFETGTTAGLAYESELRELWRVASALEKQRGRTSTGAALLDYTFYVENDRVRIVPRKRGSPLDKLVSELMILVNSSWGELLAERDVAGIYRVQSLQPGTYTVSFQAGGFKRVVQEGLVLRVGDVLPVDAALQIGAAEAQAQPWRLPHEEERAKVARLPPFLDSRG